MAKLIARVWRRVGQYLSRLDGSTRSIDIGLGRLQIEVTGVLASALRRVGRVLSKTLIIVTLLFLFLFLPYMLCYGTVNVGYNGVLIGLFGLNIKPIGTLGTCSIMVILLFLGSLFGRSGGS